MTVHKSAKLPKLKLPEFNGQYTEWINWLNTFNSLIESDCELQELSKFIHLRSCLGAIPLRTIESLEITADNYSQAIAILKERFDSRAIILQGNFLIFPKLRKLVRLFFDP